MRCDIRIFRHSGPRNLMHVIYSRKWLTNIANVRCVFGCSKLVEWICFSASTLLAVDFFHAIDIAGASNSISHANILFKSKIDRAMGNVDRSRKHRARTSQITSNNRNIRSFHRMNLFLPSLNVNQYILAFFLSTSFVNAF